MGTQRSVYLNAKSCVCVLKVAWVFTGRSHTYLLNWSPPIYLLVVCVCADGLGRRGRSLSTIINYLYLINRSIPRLRSTGATLTRLVQGHVMMKGRGLQRQWCTRMLSRCVCMCMCVWCMCVCVCVCVCAYVFYTVCIFPVCLGKCGGQSCTDFQYLWSQDAYV